LREQQGEQQENRAIDENRLFSCSLPVLPPVLLRKDNEIIYFLLFSLSWRPPFDLSIPLSFFILGQESRGTGLTYNCVEQMARDTLLEYLLYPKLFREPAP